MQEETIRSPYLGFLRKPTLPPHNQLRMAQEEKCYVFRGFVINVCI